MEAEVRSRPPDVRLEARQNRAKLLVDVLREILDIALRHLSPKSDMAKAIGYGTKRCHGLCRFVHDGRLEIDNTITERAVRGVAVGRRSWLSAGSKTGGESAAAIYTVIQTCRSMASTRRPTSPTSLRRSQRIGRPRDTTNSCPGTRPSSLRTR
jgi:transposase